MAKFTYKAKTSEGKEVTGTHSASTAANVRTALMDRDLEVLEVEEKRGILQFELTKKKVPRVEVMHLSRQLAAFLRAGVPMLDAIQAISEESDNPTFRRALVGVNESLRGGDPLSAAMGQQAHVFPHFYVSMVRSAELTGQLDLVLDQLASYIERDIDARRKIRSALAYPAVIFFVASFAIIVLTTFVLPRFRTFFEALNAKLPLPTRILLGTVGFLSEWGWLLLTFLILLGLAFYLSLKTRRGRKRFHSFLLRAPAIGGILRFSIIERFCRTLSALTEAGVPLPEAMATVADTTNNLVFEDGLLEIREAMLRGEGIATPIVRSKLFPGAVTQMVRVGEETGTLDQQLGTAANFYEQELDYKLKRLVALFEPAMIIFVGVLVGFVAIALVSAMYGIFRQVGQLS